MKKINVLVCTDDNYVPQCGIMLTSLFVNNKSNNLQIFVLSEEINETGDKAKVTLNVVYGNGEEDEQVADLVKNENGEWKLKLGK